MKLQVTMDEVGVTVKVSLKIGNNTGDIWRLSYSDDPASMDSNTDLEDFESLLEIEEKTNINLSFISSDQEERGNLYLTIVNVMRNSDESISLLCVTDIGESDITSSIEDHINMEYIISNCKIDFLERPDNLYYKGELSRGIAQNIADPNVMRLLSEKAFRIMRVDENIDNLKKSRDRVMNEDINFNH